MRKTVFIVMAALLLLGMTACGNSMEQQPSQTENIEQEQTVTENTQTEVDTVDDEQRNNLSGTIPDELEYIPDGYRSPSEHPGTLEKLTYQTWESFSYEDHAQELTKEAWVYLPYGYSEEQKYNVFYLSHGGWSNETSLMGTDEAPHSFKYVIDHAIEDGKIQPIIIVLPTYNNTSGEDSGNYSLALQLTDQFHNELLNDLVPAVESKYSTYAEDTTSDGLIASRDHRGFGGFSMGSVNTWCTFRYGLGYFRYFMPMSGGPAASVETYENAVMNSGYEWDDFFIFSASGTDDFAYSGFTHWQKATAVFSVSQTMRQMEIYPSWNEKDMPMMDSLRMNIPIMDYGSSGMEVMRHE